MTDQEALAIINRLMKVDYEDEKEGSHLVGLLQKVYPTISDLIFWDFRKLTAEQILAEAKKAKKLL